MNSKLDTYIAQLQKLKSQTNKRTLRVYVTTLFKTYWLWVLVYWVLATLFSIYILTNSTNEVIALINGVSNVRGSVGLYWFGYLFFVFCNYSTAFFLKKYDRRIDILLFLASLFILLIHFIEFIPFFRILLF